MKIQYLLFILMATNVYADEEYASFEEFKNNYIGSAESGYDTNGARSENHMVISIYPRDEKQKRNGGIFILSRSGNGKYKVADSTEQSGDLDPGDRTYMEFAEFHGYDRFYLQYNSRSACGVYVTIYRFKLVNGEWRVSGSDSSKPECSGEGIVITRKISRNFLTGKVVHEYYSLKGKVIRSDVTKENFPVFPFRNFKPYDEKYGKTF